MRTKIEWRSVSKVNYINFCSKNPDIKISFEDWKKVIYGFNHGFRTHILETGEKAKLPFGLGELSISKKKRKRIIIIDGVEHINLPVDWKKSKEKGKKIYNFNYHTEGFFFGWHWFKPTARFKHSNLWYFKACRVTSRLITEYINKDEKFQHIYQEWNLKI